MGRKSENDTYTLKNNNQSIKKEIELFPWEKLDYVEKIKKCFSIL